MGAMRGLLALAVAGLLAWATLRPAPSTAGPGPHGGAFESPAACRAHLAARDPGRAPPRIASWNIRWFPDGSTRRSAERATDVDWLACAIAALQVQVLAVQEILQSPRGRAALLDLLDRLDALTGGRWQHEMDDCPGSGRQHVGLLYDASRVELQKPRMVAALNPGSSACDRNLRPGFAAYLRFAGGPDLHLVTLHLDSGQSARDHGHRATSLERLRGVVAGLSAVAPDDDVVVLGDFNSMGCSRCEPPVGAAAELSALEQAAAAAGLERLTADPGCSHYYRGRPGNLDHALVRRGMAELDPRAPLGVAGPCAELACERLPRGRRPAAFERLSDHCPLVVQLTDRDRD